MRAATTLMVQRRTILALGREILRPVVSACMPRWPRPPRGSNSGAKRPRWLVAAWASRSRVAPFGWMPSSEETDGREKLKVTSAATDTLVQESRGTDPSLVEGRRLAAGLGVPAPALHKESYGSPPARPSLRVRPPFLEASPRAPAAPCRCRTCEFPARRPRSSRPAARGCPRLTAHLLDRLSIVWLDPDRLDLNPRRNERSRWLGAVKRRS